MIQLLDELKGKVESDLSAEEKMMEEYDLAHIPIWDFSDMFGSRQGKKRFHIRAHESKSYSKLVGACSRLYRS